MSNKIIKNQIRMRNNLDYILKIGVVTAVNGRTVDICVDKSKNASHLLYNGALLKNVSVGSYIKISKGFEELIGKIEGEHIAEDKTTNKQYSNNKERIKRYLDVKLIGYLEKSEFRQGIKELPLLDNECYLLTATEFNQVHKFVNDKEKEHVIRLGTLASETGIAIELGVNNLFASHIGIFGNTGSGKSYTLAKFYHELLKKYKEELKFQKNAKFILIDFNGEYVNPVQKNMDYNFPDIIIEEQFKSEFKLTTDKRSKNDNYNKFPISKKILSDLNFWTILLKATEQTQRPFLDNAINSSYLNDKLSSEQGIKDVIKSNLKLFLTEGKYNQDDKFHITYLDDLKNISNGTIFQGIDKLISYYLSELKTFITNRAITHIAISTNYSSNDNVSEFVKKHINEKVDELISVNMHSLDELYIIHLKTIFNYYFTIYNGFIHKDFIAPLMARLQTKIKEIDKVFEFKSQTIIDKPLTVISLKAVNVEMRKIIPLIIAKEYYEMQKNSNKHHEKYLNIIVDEAHNVLSRNSNRESETWKDYRLETFEEIIKEGRKFGVFLTIASQRPSDISDTIISQLHNYFLHRLINNKDIDAIEKTVSYLDKVSFDNIPILPQGTCILAGLSAQIPVVIKVDKIPDENENGDKIRYAPFNETINLTNNWIDSK